MVIIKLNDIKILKKGETIMNKIKAFFQGKKAKKLLAVAMAICVMSLSAVTCFAAEGEAVTDISPEAAATQVFGFLAEQLNFTTILSVLGVVIGASLAMVLGWWAIRKIKNSLLGAFESGTLNI